MKFKKTCCLLQSLGEGLLKMNEPISVRLKKQVGGFYKGGTNSSIAHALLSSYLANMLTVMFFVLSNPMNSPYYQVSTSSSVVEEREVAYTSSQPDSSIQWNPLGEEAMEMKDETGEPRKPVTVRFVLEESTGYMEPMLRILAILHTVISFFCIIGYYCLKAGYLLLIYSRDD